MAIFRAGAIGVDFDILDLSPLISGSPYGVTPTSSGLSVGGTNTSIFGTGFTFSGGGPPTAGVINRIVVLADVGTVYDIDGLSLSAATFRNWVVTADNASAKAGIFAGSDSMTGSSFDDRIRGYAGDDTIVGGSGNDVLDGGDGNDSITAGLGADTVTDAAGTNYLRGDEGDDLMIGGTGFDDINGNQGNDTVMTGAGDDYCVGGKDNDLLFGEDGNDLVYGNLGDDTCDGGAGNDIVRGGQGNDSLTGGSGNDFVSGDRGDDTMTGGSGADIFHSSADAGVDRVLDFSLAEGDRVQLDPGTTFTITQVGGDTVIQMSAGQVILVGVTNLPPSAVFVG